MDEIFAATLLVVRALDELDVEYYVGGSVVSSIHGVPRTTHDVDIVALLTPAHAPRLVEKLQADFYIDEPMIHDAIRTDGCFNLIYLPTMFKVDVFTPQRDEKIAAELSRRQAFRASNDENVSFNIASAEDIVLEKLRWYQLGNQASERQWKDVQGVLRVKGAQLDLEYLRSQAHSRGIGDLVARALAEAGLG